MRRGHRMEVPSTSAQAWLAAFTGAYDDEEIDLLLGHVEPDTFVLDVGASLGFYTVPMAEACRRSGGRVVAVEPVAANCEALRRNSGLNGLADVVDLLPIALGRRREQVVLHVETGGAGNAAIVSGLADAEVARHDAAGGTGDSQLAEVHRLDDLELPSGCRHRRCSVVKMDTEGFELDVLEGAEGFVGHHRPVIYAEFHPMWLATRGAATDAPQRWATAHGYDCAELVYKRASPVLERRRVSLRPLAPGLARSGTSLLLTPRSD